jgi:predicted acylesterase/phospholipase RssA
VAPLTAQELEPKESANPVAPTAESAALGLALSGGGVRAALFSLGVVIGFIEAQCHKRVRCIASVSGGSILNAALAHCAKPGGYSTVEEFQTLASRLASSLASQGVFAFNLRTIGSGIWFVLQIAGRAALPVLITFAILVDQLREQWQFNLADIDYSRVPWQLVSWIVLILLLLSGVIYRGLFQEAKYSKVLGAVHNSITGGSLLVKDWGTVNKESSGVMHVLVATDLLSGEPMYFSSRFVHCRCYGWSAPGELRTAEALYSSAAFPAVMPPKKLRLSRLAFQNGEMPGPLPRSVRLADGGVYNNLGTDWFDVLAEQSRTSRPLLWPFGEVKIDSPPLIETSNVIVVNASAPSRRVRRLLPFPLSLSRIMSVLYDNTVRPRVRSMLSENRPLIDIDNSPIELAKRLAQLEGEAGIRAKALATKLEGMTDEFWADFKSDAAGTKTKLSGAGRRTGARLMLHGYLLSLVLLHVRFGATLPKTIRGEKYFLSLASGEWNRESSMAADKSSPQGESTASPTA